MNGAPLAAFESGMHQAFLASFVVTLVAAVISALRPVTMIILPFTERISATVIPMGLVVSIPVIASSEYTGTQLKDYLEANCINVRK